jgi:hypothetical protein
MEVRFCAESGSLPQEAALPKRANSGHRQSVSMRARPQYAAAGRLGSVNDASKGVHCWCQKIILMLVPE